jgi:hypothetical protein
MKRLTRPIHTALASSVAFALLQFAAPLSAAPQTDGQQTLRESKTRAQKRTRKARQVSGTILDSKLVAIGGTETPNVVVLLKTSQGDRRLAVDLGPRTELAELDLRKGQVLAVEGVVVRIADAQFLVAGRLKQAERLIAVRRDHQTAQLASGTEAIEPTVNIENAAQPAEATARRVPQNPDIPTPYDEPTEARPAPPEASFDPEVPSAAERPQKAEPSPPAAAPQEPAEPPSPPDDKSSPPNRDDRTPY